MKRIGKCISEIILSLMMVVSLWFTTQPVVVEAAPSVAENVIAVIRYTSSGQTSEVSITDEYSMGYAWSRAMSLSASDITFTMYRDWTADSDGSLGSGTGFANGRINVTKSVTLDLNGHRIDRHLIEGRKNGQVIRLSANTLTIRDSSTSGSGRITGGYNTGSGGGIYIATKGSDLYLYGGSIEGNIAKYGAGVYLEQTGDRLYMYGGSISHNNAKKQGGGVYVYRGRMELYDGEVSYNRAQGNTTYADGGGGIYLDDSGDTFRMSGGSVSYNEAVRNGAGIYAWNGHLTVTGGTISNNTAQNSGGGFYDRQGGQKFSNVVFDGNSADNEGSAMTLGKTSGTVLDNVTITNNVVKDSSGAAVYNDNTSKLTIRNCTITYNRTIKGESANTRVAYKNYSHINESSSTVSHNVSNENYTLNDVPEESRPVVSEPVTEDAIYGTYQYPAANAITEKKTEFVFKDEYFEGRDGTEFDWHLATMSMNLAMSAFASYTDAAGTADPEQVRQNETDGLYATGQGRDHNVYDLLTKIGFTDFTSNYPHATIDTMGYAIAQKQIGDKTVVAVAMRGANYEAEWASNVTIGNSGEHEGFANGANIAFAGLQSYIEQYDLDPANLQFWVVGYSRGGAVANLTAKRIVDAYNHDGKNVFAYSFEPPKGGVGSAKIAGNNYDGLHCIVNKTDIVPFVAPTEMGFIHYGTVVNVPAETVETIGYESRKLTMLDNLENINEQAKDDFTDTFNGATFNLAKAVVDGVHPKRGYDRADVWLNHMVYDLVDWHDLDDISNFTNNYNVPYLAKNIDMISIQTALQDVFKIYSSMTAADMLSLKNSFRIFDLIDIKLLAAGSTYYGMIAIDKSYQKKDNWTVIALVPQPFRGGALVGAYLTAQDMSLYHTLSYYAQKAGVTTFDSSMRTLIDFALCFVSNDYINNYGDHMGTLMENISTLAQAHYPEINLAWLRTYDSYYTEDGTANVDHKNRPTISYGEDENAAYSTDVLDFTNTDSWNLVNFEYQLVKEDEDFPEGEEGWTAISSQLTVTNPSTTDTAAYKIRVRAVVYNPKDRNITSTTNYTEGSFTISPTPTITFVDATYGKTSGSVVPVDAEKRNLIASKGSKLTLLADEKEDRRFDHWEITSKDGETHDAVIEDSEEDGTELTVNTNRALTVKAVYEEKVDSVNISFKPYESRAVSWWIDGHDPVSTSAYLTKIGQTDNHLEYSEWEIHLERGKLGKDEFADVVTALLLTNVEEDPMFVSVSEPVVDTQNTDWVKVTFTTYYHDHTYGDWTDAGDEEHHMRQCVDDNCPDVSGSTILKDHILEYDHEETDDDGNTVHIYKCTVCGYELRSEHKHVFGDWIPDTDTHYQHCVAEDAGEHADRRFNENPHVDEDENGLCDVCGAEVSLRKTLTVNGVDSNPLNLDEPWTDSHTYINEGMRNDVYTAAAPVEADEVFSHWSIPENAGIIVTDKEGNVLEGDALAEALKNNQLYFKYADIVDESTGESLPGKAGTVTANYFPVVKALELETSSTPAAGEALPTLESLNLTVTNTYDIDQLKRIGDVKVEWEYVDEDGNTVRVPEGTSARYATEYTLVVSVGGIDASQYELHNDLDLSLNGTDLSAEQYLSQETAEDGSNVTVFRYTFAETETLKVMSVAPLDPASEEADWNTAAEDLNLPSGTTITTQAPAGSDQAEFDAEIEWDTSSYDPSQVGEQKIFGKVKLPGDVAPNEDVSLDVVYTVTVKEPVLGKPVVTVDDTLQDASIVTAHVSFPEDEVSKQGTKYYTVTVISVTEDGTEIVDSVETKMANEAAVDISIDLDDGEVADKKIVIEAWVELAGTEGEKTVVEKEIPLTWQTITMHIPLEDGTEATETTPYIVGKEISLVAPGRNNYEFTEWIMTDGQGRDVTSELLGETCLDEKIYFNMTPYALHAYPQYEVDPETVGDLEVHVSIEVDDLIRQDVPTVPSADIEIRVVSSDGTVYSPDGQALGRSSEDVGWQTMSLSAEQSSGTLLFEYLPVGTYTIEQRGLKDNDPYGWNVTMSADTADVTSLKQDPASVTIENVYTLKDRVVYRFTQGMGQVLVITSNEDAYFVTNGDYSLLEEIRVDGVTLTDAQMRTESGSTHIWLKNSYWKSLSLGTHTIEATYRYHEEIPVTTFTIVKPEDNSQPERKGQTCQDIGYPAGYGWNEEVQACVPYGTNKIPVVNTAAE